MHPDILAYHERLDPTDRRLCEALASTIDAHLTGGDAKVWHGHPVWFLGGNPIVGYSRQKRGIRLMFWSGADFGEPALDVVGAKFKDASVFYRVAEDVDHAALARWLDKSRVIQWNYRDIVKRKGRLERLV